MRGSASVGGGGGRGGEVGAREKPTEQLPVVAQLLKRKPGEREDQLTSRADRLQEQGSGGERGGGGETYEHLASVEQLDKRRDKLGFSSRGTARLDALRARGDSRAGHCQICVVIWCWL